MVLQVFINSERNLKNIRHNVDTEKKLQDIPDRPVEESEEKGLTIICKKTESKRPKYELRIGDRNIKQVENFKYLGSV